MVPLEDILASISQMDTNGIDHVLSALYGRVKTNREMADGLQHTVRRKREQRDTQIRKLLAYKGPDEETRRVLEQGQLLWSMKPQCFWTHQDTHTDAYLDPQVKIVRSFLQASGDDELGEPPIERTVAILRDSGIIVAPWSQALKQVQEMLDAGSRYRNLEQEICPGICLVLGKTFREYYWTKVIGKSGQDFMKVVHTVTKSDACALASRYYSLQKSIIKAEIDQLRRTCTVLPEDEDYQTLFPYADSYDEAHTEFFG